MKFDLDLWEDLDFWVKPASCKHQLNLPDEGNQNIADDPILNAECQTSFL